MYSKLKVLTTRIVTLPKRYNDISCSQKKGRIFFQKPISF